jgi:superfamily II DNA/RNA helicase
MTSATWPKEVKELSEEFLKNSVHIQIGDMDYSVNINIR